MNKIINFGTGAILLGTLAVATTAFVNADSINRQLQLGMSGSDVGILQSFLARTPSIYPEAKITNYFGALTRLAVMRFQAANGISAVGRVGPQTMAAINNLLAGLSGTVSTSGVRSITLGTIVNNGNGKTTINWATSNPARGTIYYSTSPLTMYEGDNSVSISGLGTSAGNFNTSQSLQLTGLQAGAIYYYTIYTTDQNGNVNMTWPTTFTAN